MKLRNKLIALFIIITGLTIASLVSVSAEISDTGMGIVAEEDGKESITDGTDSTDTSVPNEGVTDGGTVSDDTPNGEGDNGLSFFDELFNSFMEHSEKILGALTLIGSLILAFAYKRGFLPLVKSSLAALIDTVSKIKDNAAENDLIHKEFQGAISERLSTAETSLVKLTEHIDSLTDSLGSAEAVMTENEKLKIIMRAQVDMLFDVFMCSSLPEFQKERIGERIKEMKEALGGNETE